MMSGIYTHPCRSLTIIASFITEPAALLHFVRKSVRFPLGVTFSGFL